MRHEHRPAWIGGSWKKCPHNITVKPAKGILELHPNISTNH